MISDDFKNVQPRHTFFSLISVSNHSHFPALSLSRHTYFSSAFVSRDDDLQVSSNLLNDRVIIFARYGGEGRIRALIHASRKSTRSIRPEWKEKLFKRSDSIPRTWNSPLAIESWKDSVCPSRPRVNFHILCPPPSLLSPPPRLLSLHCQDVKLLT